MRLLSSLFGLAALAACFTPVEQRWCDTARPCSPGFVCTVDGHCVLAGTAGGGAGGGASGGGAGGGASGGGAGGGAVGGGGGGGTPIGGGGGPLGGGAGGGGGAAACSAANCPTGCCFGTRCVPANFQSSAACGLGGAQCAACPANANACVMGRCVTTQLDAGTGTVGGPCQGDAQCGDPAIAFCIPEVSGGTPTGFVGGYCSQSCVQAACPTGSSCVEVQVDEEGNTTFICLATCGPAGGCRMGYFCDQGFCLP